MLKGDLRCARLCPQSFLNDTRLKFKDYSDFLVIEITGIKLGK